jgi:predicted nucleic acid-binding Zn ribbon protein
MLNLLENFVDDPEVLLKKTRAKLKKILALELEDH